MRLSRGNAPHAKAALQRSLREALTILLNSRRHRADHAVSAFAAFNAADGDGRGDTSVTQVSAYSGTNMHVWRMVHALSSVRHQLAGAYLHGSLATGEETQYSDFDALVVVRDDVMKAPARLTQLARSLCSARRIMLEADPLQHHGWFVLTESDLEYFDDSYMPVALLQFSKSLLPDQGLELRIQMRECSRDRHMTFGRVASGMETSLRSARLVSNLYYLKIALSQFMLLPALYVQARDQQGIFKKFSFEKARKDFSISQWHCMDHVSALRREWRYDLTRMRRFLLTHPGPLRREIVARFAPPVDSDTSALMTGELREKMSELARLMADALGSTRHTGGVP